MFSVDKVNSNKSKGFFNDDLDLNINDSQYLMSRILQDLFMSKRG